MELDIINQTERKETINMKFSIKIPNEYIEMDKYELLILFQLYKEKEMRERFSIFTIPTLARKYNINTDKKNRNLNKALNSLIQKEVIFATKESNIWTVDLEKLEIPKKHFFNAYIEDVNKIFEDGNVSLFRYYCIMMSSLHTKTRKARVPMTTLGKQYNLSKATIMKYNKILEDMGIFVISHGNYLNCNIYQNCNEINKRGKA